MLERARWVFVATAWLVGDGVLLARDKTDIVYFKNGDRLTCEIRELASGKLRVKTNGLGTVEIEWDKISHLESRYVFQLQLRSGIRYVGTLKRGSDDKAEVQITGISGGSRLANERIIEMVPLEESFFQRLKGSVELGYDFTQASNATSWSLAATSTYRTEKWLGEVTVDSLFKTQEGADDVNRQTLSLLYQRFFTRRWFASGLGQVHKSANQGLDFRGLVGGGIGRHVKQSDRTRIDILAGTAFSREKYEDTPEHVQNVELLASLYFETFRFTSPKLDVSARVSFLKNIVQRDRYRVQAEGGIRFELIKDFFWSAILPVRRSAETTSASRRRSAGASSCHDQVRQSGTSEPCEKTRGNVDEVVVSRIDAGQAHPEGEKSQDHRLLAMESGQSENDSPSAGHVRARKASTRDRPRIDDGLDDWREEDALEGCHPHHDLGILPRTSSGKQRIPDEAKDEGRDHG